MAQLDRGRRPEPVEALKRFTRWLQRKKWQAITLVLVGHVRGCPVCRGSDYKRLCPDGQTLWELAHDAEQVLHLGAEAQRPV